MRSTRAAEAVAELGSLGGSTLMDDDARKLLEQIQRDQQAITTRLDMLGSMFIVLQGVIAMMATDPELLQEMETEELMTMLTAKQKTTQEALALVAALRQRRPPPQHPPHAAN